MSQESRKYVKPELKKESIASVVGSTPNFSKLDSKLFPDAPALDNTIS